MVGVLVAHEARCQGRKLSAHFISSIESKWVQAYFDIGNHVRYAPPEEWIRALGKRIAKRHVKDFRLNPDGHGGRFVNIRDGSGGPSLQEQSKRLNLIGAGK